MREVLAAEERGRSMPPQAECARGPPIEARRSASGWDGQPAMSQPAAGQRSLKAQPVSSQVLFWHLR